MIFFLNGITAKHFYDTPLIIASQKGNTEVVYKLLQHEGIDINVKNIFKKKMFFYAVLQSFFFYYISKCTFFQ